MADSKITQLPLSPYALDKDLMVVVTGHLEEGAYPYNTRMPLSYIRRYVVRLNIMTIPTSGISTYYNSGLNVLTLQHTPVTGNLMRYDYDSGFPHDQTISTTGLNAIEGNNIDIAFKTDSDAAQSMNGGAAENTWDNNFNITHLGPPYHSGIISITGVNARTENLIVRDYEHLWPFTGVYYNTGTNFIAGNSVDLVFNRSSDAALAMSTRPGSWRSDFQTSYLQNKYVSGLVSITGLNAFSGHPYGNLIRVDHGTQWPYSGIISQTGLNVIRGNLIDVQFDSTSDAATTMHSSNGAWNNNFNKNNHLGSPYHSGIISVTGLNVDGDGGNRITYNISSDWPHKYSIDGTGLNVVAGNTFSNALNGIAYNIEPDNHHRYDLFSLSKIKHYNTNQTLTVSNASRVTKYFLDAGAFISYNNIQRSKPSDSLTVLAELGVRLNDDCVTITVPTVTDSGSSNSQKTTELGSVTGTEVTIAGLTDAANTDTDSWDPWQLTIDNSTNPIVLDITISGQSVTLLDVQPIRFTTSVDKVLGDDGGSAPLGGSTVFGTDEYIYESYRGTTHLMNTGVRHLGGNIGTNLSASQISPAYDYTADPFTLGANKTMTLKGFVSPSITSSTYNVNGCVGIQYGLTNPKYIRQYRKFLGQATVEADGFSIGNDVYRYHTTSALPAEASWTINNMRYLKCEPVEQSPAISFTTQPVSFQSTDGNASFTGVTIISDYTEPHYQWEVAQSGTSSYSGVNSANNSVLNLTGKNFEDDNGDKYRLRVTAYDGLTTSTSNAVTLTVEPPTLTITDPSDQLIADDATATFTASASANLAGTTIAYQWQLSTDNEVSYSNITDATGTTLNLTSLSSSDDGNYYRLTASAVGFSGVQSAGAELHDVDITITQQPSGLIVDRGSGSFNVTATASGNPAPLYYVWQRSTNEGSSFFNIGQAGTGLATLDLTNLTYASNDQDQYRVKVRIQGFGDDVEEISNGLPSTSGAVLTVQEIDIVSQPDINSINGKDLLAPTANQNLIPTTGGSVNLFVDASGRNSSATLHYQWQSGNVPTYYYQSPTTWTNISGEISATLQVTNLAENSSYAFYKCLIDDSVIGTGTDTAGMIRKTSNTAKVTPSTFTTDSSVTLTDNGDFATVERDATSTVSETDFMTFHYNISSGVGHAVSIDANVGQQAGINFGTGLAPLGPTGIARLLAVHPNNAASNANLGAGITFNAGDVVNIQVTGNVNQYLARLNVPIQ